MQAVFNLSDYMYLLRIVDLDWGDHVKRCGHLFSPRIPPSHLRLEVPHQRRRCVERRSSLLLGLVDALDAGVDFGNGVQSVPSNKHVKYAYLRAQIWAVISILRA